MASIYGLYDTGGNPRYIGKANNPRKRLLSHMRDARRLNKTPLHRWLLKYGMPEMRVLEDGCADWQEAERRLIAEHRAAKANLLNLADGGEEPKCPREVASANGHALNARLREDSWLGAVTRLKRRAARSRRDGYWSNRIRDKYRALAAKFPEHFGAWANLPTMEEEYGCSFDTPEWFAYVRAQRNPRTRRGNTGA